MDEIVDLIQPIELFSKIKPRDLSRLAEVFESISFDHADYLTHKCDVGDSFFIIEQGRASIWWVTPDGVEQLVRRLRPGDHFGTTSLFLTDTRDATVRVEPDSIVQKLTRDDLASFLEEHENVRDALVLPKTIKERLEAPRFKWMTEEEHIVFFATKTGWALLWAELIPAGMITLLGGAGFFLQRFPIVPIVLYLLAIVIGGGFALIRWQDWRNDHYVLTNKRVVNHESHLTTLRVAIKQAPLDQIQNVTMLKPNLIARGLNYGTVEIQTAGQEGGSIVFKNLNDPEGCQKAIFDLLEKTRSLAKVSERTAIRKAIAQQFNPPEETTPQEEPAVEAIPESTTFASGEVLWDLGIPQSPASRVDKPKARQTPGDSFFARARASFLAFLPHFRQERGDTITWHKHPFVLIKAIWIPALILLVSLGLAITWAVIGGQSFGSVVLVLFVVWCLSLTGLLWQYEDWRNDCFQMTTSHVIDIDRLPLGFRESRRQAALEQIQNINVDIPSVAARIFDYGNVVIETAGATGDLTFEWVMRPRSIQAEIFARIDAVKSLKKTQEAQQRRNEMAQWLAVYHQMRERQEI